MKRLERKEYVKSSSPSEYREVHITSHGRRFLYSLTEPLRGDIAGDEASKGIIGKNQPTPNDVVRVLGLYVRIKDKERAGEPVAYQMKGK